MEQQTQTTKKEDRSAQFVRFVLERLKHDTAFGAAMRRADNPDTEYQAWEYLTKWCDLDNGWERACFATVGAGLARIKKTVESAGSIGRTILACYGGNSDDDAAKRRLRRLLACDTAEVACTWVRPVLRLACSKGAPVNFGLLLNDLLYFRAKVKERWASDFYGRREENDDSVDA